MEAYMSQEKVDKKKYQKKHRKDIERKKRVKLIVKCIVICLILGAAIGIPTGINIYKKMPKIVGDSSLKSYVGDYIDENYSDEVDLVNAIAEKNATEESTEDSTQANDATSAVEEALGGNAEVIDKDNAEELLNTDSEESSTESDNE